MSNVVEVRLGVTQHDLSLDDQVLALLRGFPERQIAVGLGYGGEAAVVIRDLPAEDAEAVASNAEVLAVEVGLTPTVVEVLTTEEYEERALAELEGEG